MMWGVPIVPIVVAFSVIALLAIWFSLLFFVLLIPVYVIMRLVVKSDDQQFRLLWLKAKYRLINYNHNAAFWKASAYSPIEFKKRKSRQ